MATTSNSQNSQKLLTAGHWHFSWRRLLIAGSVTLNIAFVVVWVTLLSSTALDGMFMGSGLERYCSSKNDDKFKNAEPQAIAMRDYVCNAPDAEPFFREGYNNYLDSKHIPRPTANQ